jgi:hypothetical protein
MCYVDKEMKMLYPKFYYQRGRVSDRDWVLGRMSIIPEDKKQSVCDEYEKLFLSGKGGRKLANTYLNGIAKEYRLNA